MMTEQALCAIAARHATTLVEEAATYNTDSKIFSAATGFTMGLFGPAFYSANDDQRMKWVNTCYREFRKALGKGERL